MFYTKCGYFFLNIRQIYINLDRTVLLKTDPSLYNSFSLTISPFATTLFTCLKQHKLYVITFTNASGIFSAKNSYFRHTIINMSILGI